VRVPPLPVIVVHRNRAHRLAATLASIAASSTPVSIIVVDAGSDPGQRRAAEAATAARSADGTSGGSVFLAAGHNAGFGPSANLGFRYALDHLDGWEWAGLCPHDALVERDTVARIVEAVRDRPRAGLVCGDFGDGCSPRFDRVLGPHLTAAPDAEGWDPVDYPHGTLLFARRRLLDEVGLFDERYFAYCEEADLGLRASAVGWEIGLVRGAIVTNPETSNATAVVDYLQTRNTVQLVARHSGRRAGVTRFVIALWQTATAKSGGMFPHRRARLLALRDVLARRTGAPPRRLADLL
jgi:N-acetylglucosaminyl-diphospho-decaprenol L-rhamnosyltransferase